MVTKLTSGTTIATISRIRIALEYPIPTPMRNIPTRAITAAATETTIPAGPTATLSPPPARPARMENTSSRCPLMILSMPSVATTETASPSDCGASYGFCAMTPQIGGSPPPLSAAPRRDHFEYRIEEFPWRRGLPRHRVAFAPVTGAGTITRAVRSRLRRLGQRAGGAPRERARWRLDVRHRRMPNKPDP